MQMPCNVTHLPRPAWSRTVPAEASVRQHLAVVLASPHFDAGSRSRAFLCYVVDEALAGRGAALNQAAIAISVFGRDAGFDPLLDPIVRVQAGRLRRSLERYYLLTGEQQRLRIELRKGSYAPAFVSCNEPRSRMSLVATPAARANSSPALLVHTFEISSVLDSELTALFADELTLDLQRYGNLPIVRQRDVERLGIELREGLQFELCGRVRQQEQRLLVGARLIDRHTAEQLWSDELDAGPAATSCCAGILEAARAIAAAVGLRCTGAPRVEQSP